MKTIFAKIAVLALFTTFFYSCSSNGQRTDWDEYDIKGKVKSFTETTFDKKEGGEKFDLKRKMVERFFDEEGNILEENYYSKDAIKPVKEIFIYKKNIKISSKKYNKKEVIQERKYDYVNPNKVEIEYFYNKNTKATWKQVVFYKDRKIVKIISKGGSLEGNLGVSYDKIYTFQYNKQKFVEKIGDGKNNIATCKYLETDDKGNWTKRQVCFFWNKEPSEITIREYTYF